MIEIAGDADNDIRSMRQRLPADVVRTSSARHRLDRSSPTAMRCLAAAAVLMLFTASTPADTVSPEVPLRGALDVFTGRWEGAFKVFTHDGRLVNELHVKQHYWSEGKIQRGRFVERDGSGRIVTVEARNLVEQGRLVCRVRKDNGETSAHAGRVTDSDLFWSRRGADVVECFRERVVKTDADTTYLINGFGVYGRGDEASHFYFEGRYRKVGAGSRAGGGGNG